MVSEEEGWIRNVRGVERCDCMVGIVVPGEECLTSHLGGGIARVIYVTRLKRGERKLLTAGGIEAITAGSTSPGKTTQQMPEETSPPPAP